MKENFSISLTDWQKFLHHTFKEYNIYAPVENHGIIDYHLINVNDINNICYNRPKPVTPLKYFFLPVKENVVTDYEHEKKNIIIGIPSCDLEALNILDEIYLKEPFTDNYYKNRRENSILIGTDCYTILKNCHCNVYGVKPFPSSHFDISLSLIDDRIHLNINSDKAISIITQLKEQAEIRYSTNIDYDRIDSKRKNIENLLKKQNSSLPDYHETGELVQKADNSVWEDYSKTCVSCGACATACPTCTCFLLIDKPGFEKVRHLDACQYPGFERIAAGEDPLQKRSVRFRNRYLCKYVWKPAKFNSVACTGCGRCIDSCIGKINKNELFHEIAGKVLI
jgi:sulfhydrogenase subunit beta (sulfur reductase)